LAPNPLDSGSGIAGEGRSFERAVTDIHTVPGIAAVVGIVVGLLDTVVGGRLQGGFLGIPRGSDLCREQSLELVARKLGSGLAVVVRILRGILGERLGRAQLLWYWDHRP